MSSIENSQPLCPYCITPIVNQSKDHIFPQFLGGKRTVCCCKKCNSVFGHTFEAEAAKILQAEHVFISSWGVPLRSADPTWKGAHVQDGKTYNLSVGETGVKPELSRPIIEHDEEGRVKSGEFVDKKQAERFARSLIEKGKAKEVRLEHVAPPQIDLTGLGNTLELGPDIRRLALKMCIALSTLLPEFDLKEVSEARLFLRGDRRLVPVNNTLAAYGIYDAIDSNRKALSHVIYVERSQTRVYGLVQFFGVVQLFCRLGKPKKHSQDAALLVTLDPVTGEEHSQEISPLDLVEPPYFLSREEYPKLMEGWMNKFRDEAIKRGATHPPDLKITSLEIQSNSFVLRKPRNDS